MNVDVTMTDRQVTIVHSALEDKIDALLSEIAGKRTTTEDRNAILDIIFEIRDLRIILTKAVEEIGENGRKITIDEQEQELA
jgi:hypothetical protein